MRTNYTEIAAEIVRVMKIQGYDTDMYEIEARSNGVYIFSKDYDTCVSVKSCFTMVQEMYHCCMLACIEDGNACLIIC